MDKALETALRQLILGSLDTTNELIGDALANAETITESLDDDAIPQIEHVRTFEDAGVLTRDKGLELTLTDHRRVYLTIQVQ